MKRIFTSLFATTITMSMSVPMAFAASSTATTSATSTATTGSTTTVAASTTTSASSEHWFQMQLQVDGTTINTPYAIAQSDGYNLTTYVPIYYVDRALSKVGYQVKWDGVTKTWSLTTTDTSLDFSGNTVGAGNTEITVNGKIIKKLYSVVNRDPDGGAYTTYVPIYYVTPLFQAVGATAVWNGDTRIWSITTTDTGTSTSSPTSSGGTASASSGSGNAGSVSSQSTSTSSTSPSLPAPSIQLVQNGGSDNITVSDAVGGGLLTLYNSTTGNSVISTSADANGQATFYNVGTGTYDVVETANGETSATSNTVTVSSTPTSSTMAPVIYANSSNGIWYIGVNNAVPTSTVTLYSTNGNEITSATANQYGVAIFPNVNTGNYYVVDIANGSSMQSNAVAVNESSSNSSSDAGSAASSSAVPATPYLTMTQNNGVGVLTVSNVSPSAQVTLYTSDGTVSNTSTVPSSGVVTFYNVTSGTYYVTQTSNGVQSAESNSVTISPAAVSSLEQPSLSVSETNGIYSLTASNVEPNATVNLYTSNGNLYSTLGVGSSSSVTFYNVASGQYDAVETLNGQTSAASNDIVVG